MADSAQKDRVVTSDSPAPPTGGVRRIGMVVRRMPATLTTIVVILVAGVATGALWSPFTEDPLFAQVAYGLPAFSEGRYWTAFTGVFFADHPFVYAFAIASFIGMGFLELQRGTRVALAYFWVGQLFAVFASALLLWLAAMTPWAWAQAEAQLLDVGPSGGTMTCLAAAACLLAQPWRIRVWMLLLGYVSVSLMYWGALADVEHAIAVVMVLVIARPFRGQRITLREQRLIAFVVMLVFGAIAVLTTLVDTDGPIGHTRALDGSLVDVAIDVGIALLVANGLRRGRLWAWVLSVIWASLNVAFSLLIWLAVAVSGSEEGLFLDGDPSATIASAVLWFLFLVYLVWVRHAFRARRRSKIGTTPATVDDAREMVRAHGGGTLSWMTTWDDLVYARTTAGLVAYQRRAGVALALGDPLGPAASRAESTHEFITMAEHAGLIPCFFSASDSTRAAVPEGWRSLIVADDTIVDLEGLQFTGKKWGSVRTSLNKADREEIDFRMTRLHDESWGVRAQLRAISEQWVGDKDLPEMGFTLGTLDEAEDPEVRIALALAPNGDVDGFLSWLPMYGENGIEGWTLDLMRRREGGFGPVMEFLIGSSARLFSDEGARVMSLSGAPLTHDYPEGAGVIADLSEKLSSALEPVYGFQSLHRFKSKFNPRYEQLYLLYRDESDLTRIGAALTRAFLPEATLRQFAGAGIDLVRGTD